MRPPEFPRRALILELATLLVAHPAVERVWLFGSRARGDHFERSDIDLAIEAPGIARGEWAKLHLDLEEDADTLLLIDFVLMDDLPESFRRGVHREGRLLYARGNLAGLPGTWATPSTGSVGACASRSRRHRDGRHDPALRVHVRAVLEDAATLSSEGRRGYSPKSTLRYAYRRGLLDQERVWLDMLEDRNHSAHVYDVEMARAIYAKLPAYYVELPDRFANPKQRQGD